MSALIYCPFPTREQARKAAGQLLDDKLIACANILGESEAIYEWQGTRESGREVAVLFKTRFKLLDKAIKQLGTIHPYECPAIIGWQCDRAHPATFEWLEALRG